MVVVLVSNMVCSLATVTDESSSEVGFSVKVILSVTRVNCGAGQSRQMTALRLVLKFNRKAGKHCGNDPFNFSQTWCLCPSGLNVVLSRMVVFWICAVSKFACTFHLKWHKTCTTNKPCEFNVKTSLDELLHHKEPTALATEVLVPCPMQCTVSSLIFTGGWGDE